MTAAPVEAGVETRMDPRRLRRTMYWLALDYLNLRTNMPTPARRETTRQSNVKDFGHPAEWASDKASEIADVLTGWHDYLAEHRGETTPRKKLMRRTPEGTEVWAWAVKEQQRVVAAWKYLEPRCEQLVEVVEKEALDEMCALHGKIRRTLGHYAPKYTLPIPCPNEECSLRTLVRIQGIGQDFISCDSCGYTIKEVHYPFLIRMLLDTLITGALQ